MTRRALIWLALLSPAGCDDGPAGTPEQWRAVCEAERTRRGSTRLLPPEARLRPECQVPAAAPQS